MNALRFGWSSAISLTLLAGCASSPPREASTPAGATTEAASPSSGGSPAAPTANGTVDQAVAAIRAGDFGKARTLLEPIVNKAPVNATAAYYYGVALEQTGDRAGAERAYEQAFKSNPTLVDAALNLGALYVEAKRFDDAAAITKQALTKAPTDASLLANLGYALEGKGDRAGATQAFAGACREETAPAEVRYNYGRLLLEGGERDKAAATLRKALASTPQGNRDLLASIGRLLGPAGAASDCVAAFDKAIALGDDSELRVRRGLCRHSLKDEPGAKADFEAALKLNAQFAPAHYYLGEALLLGGDTNQALAHFDAAARAHPESDLGKKAKQEADAVRAKQSKRR